MDKLVPGTIPSIFEGNVKDFCAQIIEFREKHGIKVALSDGEYYSSFTIREQDKQKFIDEGGSVYAFIMVKKIKIVEGSKAIILEFDVIDTTVKEMCLINVADLKQYKHAKSTQEISPSIAHVPQQDVLNELSKKDAVQRNNMKTKSASHANYVKISELDSFIVNKQWVLLGRVLSRSPLQVSKNSKKWFKISVKDSSDDVIECMFFGEDAEKFTSLIEVDKVYELSNFRIKENTNKQYSQNQYTLYCHNLSEVNPVEGDGGISKIEFSGLVSILDAPPDKVLNIIGYIYNTGGIRNQNTKNGLKPLRTITICDDSEYSVDISLWDENATQFDEENAKVILLIGVTTGEFGGRKILRTSISSTIEVNPDLPQATKLLDWFASKGKDIKFSPIAGESPQLSGKKTSDLISLTDIDDNGFGASENADFFNVYGTVMNIHNSESCYVYPGCSSETCNKKKLTYENNELYCKHCSKCITDPVYCFLFSMRIMDHSGSVLVNVVCNDDVGYSIFRMKASEIHELMSDMDANSKKSKEETFNHKEFQFRLRARLEGQGADLKTKLTVYSATPLDFGKRTIALANELLDSKSG